MRLTIRNMASEVIRLTNVEGVSGKFNDLIISGTRDPHKCTGRVLYFGGDVQDYPEGMMGHRDNKHYCEWNLEKTATILAEKFPQKEIVVVRPKRMHLKTFSCFQNFVDGDDVGTPNHQLSQDCLWHLKGLLDKLETKMALSMIGFSKGCVVLNQLLYSFLSLSLSPNPELVDLVRQIETMYWLDGGHSGPSDSWLTDKKVLKYFATMKIKVRIGVTPYQMEREARPWVPKEEKKFREILRTSGANIQRKIYFGDKPATLLRHFQILQQFEVD